MVEICNIFAISTDYLGRNEIISYFLIYIFLKMSYFDLVFGLV